MFHRIARPIVCCLLFSWGALAAPRKDDRPPVYYFPSKVGDKVILEAKEGDRSWTEVIEVTEARQKGTAVLITLRGVHGFEKETGSFRYELSEKGVYKVGEGDALLGSPECFLRLPSAKGETWETVHTTSDGDTLTGKYTNKGEEEVEVAAGKFQCLRVESECVYDGMTWRCTRWLAPRCGLVKEDLVGRDGVRDDYVRTTVLKSFAPGGK